MKKFLIGFLSVLLMFSLAACSGGENGERVSSVSALIKKLANESDKKIEISEDIVLTEPIEIVGNKEIVGSGTITVSADNMKETYMINVNDGAQLTIGGSVSIDLLGIAGGVHVNSGATFTLQDEAVIKNASAKTANALVEGTFNMNGGTIVGGYNSILCEGTSTFTWNAGLVTNAIGDAIIVGKDAKITVTSADAQLTSVAAKGVYLYGEGVIENTTMTDSMDSMIKVAQNGKLTVKGGKISDAGLYGIDNAGELLVTGGTIFENYDSGVCNTGTFEMTGGTLMNNKNKGVLNKAGTAKIVSASVTLTGNKFAVGNEEGAYFELAKAKLLQSTTSNIYAYAGEMYIHDIVLATSGSNNTRIVSADVVMENVEIKGINASGSRTMHGLLLEGGTVKAKNLIISNTTGNAIRNKGGHFQCDNLTIKDIKNQGINNTLQDVTGREGIIEIDGLTIENVQNNNILIEGGVATITNATLNRCGTNNIKVSDGKLVMTKSSVLGNVEGSKTNTHAVYMVGGTFEANNVSIENAAGAALRVNGEEALFSGKKITFKNAGVSGIDQSIGTVKIDGLKTSGIKDHNLKITKGTVDIKNATLCKTKNNNVRMTNEGNLILTDVEIQGTVSGVKEVVHGLFVSKGTTTAKNLKIVDAKVSALRVNGDAKVNLEGVEIINPGQFGMQINAGTTVITGLTTSDVPANNIQLYGEADVTVKESSLGKNGDNSIRIDDKAVLALEDVVIEGHTDKAANNAHGIYALGESTLTTKNLTVQNVKGAAVRTLDTPKVTLDDVKIKDAGTYGFRLGGGTVAVTNLKTEDVGAHNFAVETATSNLTVKDAVLCPTEDNNVRVNKGTTHFENVEILGQVKGVKEVVHGFFVSEGTTTAKNITIKNADTAAIRVNGSAKVELDGVDIQNPGQLGVQVNAGTTVITDLTTSGVPSNNIQMYGNADLTVKKATLGKNADNSIRVDEDAKLTLGNVTISGHTDKAANNAHGIYALGKSTVNAKNLTVKNVNGAAIRTVGEPQVDVNGVKVTDTITYGFNLGGGKISLSNVITDKVGSNDFNVNAAGNNFNIDGKATEVTVKKATLCATGGNNVRINNGTTHFEDVEINGHVDGAKGTVHGFFVSGGTTTAKDLTVSDTKFSAIRVSGGKLEAEDVEISNTGDCGINATAGATKITGITTSDVTANNVYAAGTAGVTLNNATLGASDKENVKFVENAEFVLNKATINGTTGKGGYIFCAEGKKAVLNDVTITDENKNDYVGIWLNSSNCELTATNIETNNMDYGIIGNSGNATITGLNSEASVQNIYVNGADVTINGYDKTKSILAQTSNNNIKVEKGELYLNDVTINGTTGDNTNGIFVTGTGEVEANRIHIQNTKAAAFRIKETPTVTASTVTTANIGGHGINMDGGTATFTGFNTSGVTGNNIYLAGTCNATVNNSVLCATSAENVKITGDSELTLNSVSVNGKTGANGYMFCAEGKKAELNDVTIADTDKNDYVGIWLNADNCELIGNNVTLKDMKYGLISNKGKATITGLTSYATTQDIWSKAGTVNVENLNNTVTEKAIIYNTTSNLNLAGVINATVTNDAKVAVNATKSLAGSTMVIDWTEGKIPEDLVGIKFVNEADAQASKQAVSLGANSGAKYDTYFFGNQMLLSEKSNRRYTVENYQGLVSALADVEEKNATSATITIIDSFDMLGTVSIPENSNVTIQDDGTARTIQRGAGFALNTRGVLFDVNSGATLTLRSTGTKAEPKLTFDGNRDIYSPTNTKDGNWAMINAKSGASGVKAYEGVQFINNSSHGAGAVIRMEAGSGAVYVDGAKFQNNTANANTGGAIWIGNNLESNEIKNTIFINNSAKYGGAIFVNDQADITVSDSIFSENKALGSGAAGGAVYAYWGEMEFIDCTFEKNTSAGDGGAIYSQQITNITNCYFAENSATNNGGAIYHTNENGVATLTGGNSDKAVFYQNSAANGGAIYTNGKTFNITNYKMNGNSATEAKDICVAKGKKNPTTDMNISGKIVADIYYADAFKLNVTGTLQEGSAVNVDWKSSVPSDMIAVSFANGDVMNASKEYITLGAIQSPNYVLEYSNASAKLEEPYRVPSTNYADLQAAITTINSSDKIGVIRLIGNVSIGSTVSIPQNCDIVIEDDGTARTIQRGAGFALDERGVLLDVESGATLTLRSTGTKVSPKLTFDGNKSTYSPTNGNWAIVNAKSGTNGVKVYEGVQFINNSSTGAGAVLRMESGSGSLYVDGAKFQDNTANSNTGGAIWIGNDLESNEIKNATFINNSAKYGGAIFVDNQADITVSDSIFSVNKAVSSGAAGGAVYAYWGEMEFIGCTFEKNTSAGDGGAIYSQQITNITNCYFTENSASNKGGAIYHTNKNGKATLTGTNPAKAIFSGNYANVWGGAIYTDAGKAFEVDGYTFDGNYSQAGGAILMFSEANVSNTIFKNNYTVDSGTKDGGAIYVTKNATFDNCEFDNNRASSKGGAILINGSTTTLTATQNDKARFKNNTATSGNAICVYSGTLTGTGYSFEADQDITTNNGNNLYQ